MSSLAELQQQLEAIKIQRERLNNEFSNFCTAFTQAVDSSDLGIINPAFLQMEPLYSPEIASDPLLVYPDNPLGNPFNSEEYGNALYFDMPLYTMPTTLENISGELYKRAAKDLAYPLNLIWEEEYPRKLEWRWKIFDFMSVHRIELTKVNLQRGGITYKVDGKEVTRCLECFTRLNQYSSIPAHSRWKHLPGICVYQAVWNGQEREE